MSDNIKITGVLNAINYARKNGFHGVLQKDDEGNYIFPKEEEIMTNEEVEDHTMENGNVRVDDQTSKGAKGIVCGNCKKNGEENYYHDTVAEVRSCYGLEPKKEKTTWVAPDGYNRKDDFVNRDDAVTFAKLLAEDTTITNIKVAYDSRGHLYVSWTVAK